MSEENPVRGAVLYTDGGCHRKQKIGGIGVHGYVYQESPPKKGAGLAGYVLTPKGYKQKTPDDNPKGPVFIEAYIDQVGAQPTNATNNTAELGAFQSALALVLEKTIEADKVHIISDSEYVLKGVANIETMKKRDWRKADGAPYKNVDYWKRIDQYLQEIKKADVAFSCDWVKGHDNEPGNVRADTLATIGLNYALREEAPPETWISPADGYWKNTAQFSRLFGAHHVVFAGASGTALHEDEWQYRLYNDTSKQSSLRTFGTALAGASYGYLRLRVPHPEIELVMAQQKQALQHSANAWDVCLTRPQDIYRPNTVSVIQQYGKTGLCPSQEGELFSPMKQRLTTVFKPALQSLNALNVFDQLERVFRDAFKEKSPYALTDITDSVFSKTIKPAKGKKPEEVVYKLISYPDYDDQYFDVTIKGKVGEKTVERPIRLIYGIDLPIRNALTNAAKHVPEVWVASYVEPDGVWRYYTFVKTQEGTGVWHNPFSSIMLPVLAA